MYSFYGGRPGAPFVIIKSFGSVSDMNDAFSGGSGYTDVHYDQYVIIDTTDKNNENNGKIYRRGYNGAEYIGQIVGPAGPAPNLVLTNDLTVPQGTNPNLTANGSYNKTLNNLVPGKYTENGQEKFNDEIKWISYSIKDANSTETTAYIGFKIPYTVFDVSVEPADTPYDDPTVTQQKRIDSEDEGVSHPFYENWKFKIPKGKKGDSIKGLKVITADSSDGVTTTDDYNLDSHLDDQNNERKILVYEKINYDDNASGAKTTYYLGDYNMIENVDLDEDGFLTVSYTHDDDQTVNNTPIKWIDNIAINENTKDLIVTYNTKTVEPDPENEGQFLNVNEKTTFENILKTVNRISLTEQGYLLLQYNTVDLENPTTQTITNEDEEVIGTITQYPQETELLNDDSISPVKWIKNIVLDSDNSKLIITYNIRYSSSIHGNDETLDEDAAGNLTQSFPITLIDNVSFDEDSGNIYISYKGSNDPVRLGTIRFIKNLDFNEDTGFITATYPTGILDPNSEEGEKQYLDEVEVLNNTPIKWIKEIEESQEGDLIITYNLKTQISDPQNIGQYLNENISQIFEKALDVPKGITMDSDYAVKITWKSKENGISRITDLGTINAIKKATIDNLGNLLIQWTDPQSINSPQNYPYNNENWTNLGKVSAVNLLFNETDVSLSNKFLSGIIKKEEEVVQEETVQIPYLIFDLSTTKISNRILRTTIENCSIKIFDKNNNSPAIVTINNENIPSYTVENSAFGFTFKFNLNDLLPSIEQPITYVDILIEQMDLSFEIDTDASSSQGDINLPDLKANVDSLKTSIGEGSINSENNNFYPTPLTITNALKYLATKIGTTSISKTITQIAADYLDDRGTGTITSSTVSNGKTNITVGSNTIIASLNSLKTNIMNIISGSTVLNKLTTNNEIKAGTTLSAGTAITAGTTITAAKSITTGESLYANDKLTFRKASGTNAGSVVIQALWDDELTHNVVERSQDGLTSYFGWTGSSTKNNVTTYYQSKTRIRGYYTYISSHKGTINTDKLWKANGETWQVNYAGGGYLTSSKTGLRLTVGIPCLQDDLSVTSITDLTVCKSNGGSVAIGTIAAKNIIVYPTVGNARIHINNLNTSYFNDMNNNSPVGIVCKINFKAIS